MLAAALAAAGSLRPLQPEQEAGSLVPLQPEQEAGTLVPLQLEQENRGGGGGKGGGRGGSSGDANGDAAADKLLARAKPGEAAGVQNFVIFSRARSGTTWLISMLNGHPEISCDGELLLQVKTDAALKQFYAAFDGSGRLHEGTKARERSKQRIGAQGFKWFHYQASIELFEPYYNWNLDNATRARNEDRAQKWAAWLQRNHFKVVVFEREDRLARMVSEAKHNMLKDYMCSTEKCVDEHRKKKVYLKPEHLKLKLLDDEEIGTSTVGWLNKHGFNDSQVHRARCATRMRRPPCVPRARPTPQLAPRRAQKTFLTYHQLVKDPEAQVSLLYGFLGVDQKQPFKVNATMKMDTAAKLADEIENLQEVEEALQGTKYLKELYDLQFYGYNGR